MIIFLWTTSDISQYNIFEIPVVWMWLNLILHGAEKIKIYKLISDVDYRFKYKLINKNYGKLLLHQKQC